MQNLLLAVIIRSDRLRRGVYACSPCSARRPRADAADTGLFPDGLDLNYTPFTVFIGIVYCYLPLAILPIYAVLDQRDRGLIDRPGPRLLADAGVLWITLPMSLPGVGVAALLVGIPSS